MSTGKPPPEPSLGDAGEAIDSIVISAKARFPLRRARVWGTLSVLGWSAVGVMMATMEGKAASAGSAVLLCLDTGLAVYSGASTFFWGRKARGWEGKTWAVIGLSSNIFSIFVVPFVMVFVMLRTNDPFGYLAELLGL